MTASITTTVLCKAPWSRIRRWIEALVIGLGILAGQPVSACDWPQSPYLARYEVSRNGKPLGAAEARLEFIGPDRARYSMVTEAESGVAGLFGARIAESAELALNGGAWRSLVYRYRQKVALSRRRQDITFDWQGGQVHGSGRGDDWALALQGDESDRLTVNLRLANRLKGQEHAFVFTTVEDGERRERTFKRGPAATISTPAGRFQTVEVARVHGNPDRRTRSWHAPQLDYLPIRIEQHKPDGEQISMVLASYQALPCGEGAEAR